MEKSIVLRNYKLPLPTCFRNEKESHMQMAVVKDRESNHGIENGNLENINTQASRGGVKIENPKPGMVFWSEEEVRDYCTKYAQQEGFGVAKRSTKTGDDGMQKYFSLACARDGKSIISAEKDSFYPRPSSKTNCKSKINLTVQSDGSFVITRAYLDHNHGLCPGKVKHFRRKKTMDSPAKRKLERDEEFLPFAVEAGGCGDLAFVQNGCSNYMAKARELRLEAGDIEALFNCFQCMQNRDSSFFYVIDVDKECRIKNVFWADARSRAAYESFGDVISFYTSYLTNGYDMPLVLFVGINHHGQSLLLGCGLLSNEDKDTYVWLFKTWLSCMFGQCPKAIVTDQCKDIQAAVAEAFPNSQHRPCLWHIMKRLPMKLGGLSQDKAVKKVLRHMVFESTTLEQFEDGWDKMIAEYKLEENEWLQSLYTNRYDWVPVFVKSTFWAGTSIAQRSEGINAYFDGYVHSKTTLKQFADHYENVLKSKIEKESNTDLASAIQTWLLLITVFHV